MSATADAMLIPKSGVSSRYSTQLQGHKGLVCARLLSRAIGGELEGKRGCRDRTIAHMESWVYKVRTLIAVPLSRAQKSSNFINVKQKPEEPFEHFVARVTEAVSQTDLIVKQLAFENATPTCQTLIQPVRKTGELSAYVRTFAEVAPSYIQGLTIAGALQGQTDTGVLKNMRGNQAN